MAYNVSITLRTASHRRKPLPFGELPDAIKAASNLKSGEAKRLVSRLMAGEDITFRPRDGRDADAAFRLVNRLKQLGFAAEVGYWVSGTDLPYLVNAEGKVDGSEKVSDRELNAEAVEELLSRPDVPLVITGYGDHMEWIPEREKHAVWRQKIKPQLIDYQNSQRRNDYFLYTATEWVAQSGKSYILIWTLD